MDKREKQIYTDDRSVNVPAKDALKFARDLTAAERKQADREKALTEFAKALKDNLK